ncbi:MAG: glycosyltransferase family 4 protein [Candidatus Eisenbacteria bacterium]|nr:glycosyltransferase family 4 protein [Candidatus Eisenbacteria bacterium]
MKILYVCSDPSIRPGSRGGGFTTHMEEMIESFRKLGNEVVVVDTKTGSHEGPQAANPKSDCLEKDDPRTERTRNEGSQEVGPSVARSRGVDWRNARKVPRVLRVTLRDLFYCLHNAGFYFRVAAVLKKTRNLDFVYERYCVYQFATSMAARKRGVPLILEVNASTDEFKLTDGLGLRPLAALVERVLTRRADAVITVSGFLRDRLVRRGVPPEKIHVMHNGVNLSKFCPDTPGDAIRRTFELSREDVVAGFVGGFSAWHGAHLLLDVAPLAVKENKRIRFFMVGGREGSPRFERFRKSVRERGLTEIFRFAGEVPRERVPEHIAAMDVAVISWATDYGSPTKTFEYMAMAKALVAPRVAALEEVLTHEKTALLVAAADVQDMARAIVRLASDRNLRDSLGANARRAVEEKYNWDRNAAATVEIAKGLIG